MLRDYQSAIDDFSKAIELNPKNAAAIFNRGVSKMAIGQRKLGCNDIYKASELDFEQANTAYKQYCR